MKKIIAVLFLSAFLMCPLIKSETAETKEEQIEKTFEEYQSSGTVGKIEKKPTSWRLYFLHLVDEVLKVAVGR